MSDRLTELAINGAGLGAMWPQIREYVATAVEATADCPTGCRCEYRHQVDHIAATVRGLPLPVIEGEGSE